MDRYNSTFFNYTNSSIPDGTYTAEFWCNDTVGNINNTENFNYTNSSIPDGTYTAEFWCNDTVGNINNTENVTFTIDITYPIIRLDAPSNNTWQQSGQVTFQYNATDTNLKNCTLYGDFTGTWAPNATNTSVTSGSQDSINLTLTNGTYLWNVLCYDYTGNNAFNSTNYTINIDTIEPNITVTSPVNTSYYNNSNTLFNVSSTEEGTGFILPDLDSTLISWWRMDDVNSSGDPTDYMNRNNGTKVGNATQIINGKFGKGFEFDGAGDYVDVGNSDTLKQLSRNNTNVTFSLWIKTTATSGAFFGKQQPYELRIGSNSLQFRIDNTTANLVALTANTPINDGKWHHGTIVLDRSENLTIYIDGIFDTTTDISFIDQILSEANNLLIGQRSGGVRYLNGTIDEVMIFNRSLSTDEILSLYNATKLQHTETLPDGYHTFKAYTSDLAANLADSGLIEFDIDTIYPNISFVPPTPANDTTQYVDWINVNVSAADSANNISTFIDIDNKLVAWWRFDDVNQTAEGALVYDYTGVNNGTAYGNASQTDAGYFGKGFEFDGDGDYVETGTSVFDVSEPFTVSVWIKANSGAGQDAIITKYSGSSQGFILRKDSVTTVDVWLSNAAVEFSTSVNTDAWYLITVAYNGSDTFGYVNGNLDGSFPYARTLVNAGNFQVGYSQIDYFNGTIDDVMIFNRSLSAEEVAALYANQTSRYLVNNYTNLTQNIIHTFKAYTQDRAGNINTTETRQVIIDTIEPGITLTAPAQNQTLNSSNVTFNFTATDNFDTNLTCNITINSTVNVSDIPSLNGTPTLYNITGFSDGFYLWNVTCWDNVNNTNTSATWNFTISTYDFPPKWNNLQTNAPGRINEQKWFYANWSDDKSLSSYIFAWNGTNGSWINDSAIVFTGSANQSNVTKTINLTGGNTIGWRFYANDSTGQWNVTDISTFVVISTAPNISGFNMTDDSVAAGYQINPIVDSQKTFYVWFNVTDADGASDINSAWIKVWNSTDTESSPTYSNYSIQQVSCSAYTCLYNGSIAIWYYDEPGTWNISVYGNDSGNLNGSYYDNFNVTEQSGFTLVNAPVQFGALLPNLANQNASVGNGFPLVVENKGNTLITMNLSADGNLTGATDPTYSIPVENIDYANESSFISPADLNITSKTFKINLTVRSNYSLYFRITIPQIKAQQYNTSITFENI
jgi:hypothetical protein